MRGLTNEERHWLTSDACDLEIADRLEARGLVVTGNCVDCGKPEPECSDECCGDIEMPLTALGHLALRLDAAARQLEGVSA